jgi:hypothetical protein
MNPLVKKLGLKTGHRALLVNPPPGYRDRLDPLPDGVDLTEDVDGTFDFAQVFVRSSEDLDGHLPAVIGAIKPEGLLWISYPKGGSRAGTNLNRDILWARVEPSGWTGVSLVAVDDVWSAMRFRPAERVGK